MKVGGGRGPNACRARTCMESSQAMNVTAPAEDSSGGLPPKVDAAKINLAQKDGPLRQKQVRQLLGGNSFGARENLLLAASAEERTEAQKDTCMENDGFATAPRNPKGMSLAAFHSAIKPLPLFQTPSESPPLFQGASPSDSWHGDGVSPDALKFSGDILAPMRTTQENTTNRFLFNLAAQSKQARQKGMATLPEVMERPVVDHGITRDMQALLFQEDKRMHRQNEIECRGINVSPRDAGVSISPIMEQMNRFGMPGPGEEGEPIYDHEGWVADESTM